MFHLILRVLFLRAQPIASTHLCGFQTCLLTFVLLDAALLKISGGKDPEDLACSAKGCPNRYVHAACLDPIPDGWWWQWRSRNQGLNPDFLVIVYFSSDMPLHGYTSWLDQFDIALRYKRFAACLADIVCDACSVVKQDDKTIDSEHGISINMIQCKYRWYLFLSGLRDRVISWAAKKREEVKALIFVPPTNRLLPHFCACLIEYPSTLGPDAWLDRFLYIVVETFCWMMIRLGETEVF